MYFFDSYALIEVIKGNKNYEKYETTNPICTILNLFELHQYFLKEFNKQTADFWIKKFDYKLLEITKGDIIKASDFRFLHRKKELSSIDCIGYILAKKHNLKFLTGDSDFEKIENAEFVK